MFTHYVLWGLTEAVQVPIVNLITEGDTSALPTFRNRACGTS